MLREISEIVNGVISSVKIGGTWLLAAGFWLQARSIKTTGTSTRPEA
jgi:hypothetical protein